MTRWDLLHIIGLVVVVVFMFVQAMQPIVGNPPDPNWQCLLVIGLLLQSLNSLLYVRFRLLPIAYPALYRKEDDE